MVNFIGYSIRLTILAGLIYGATKLTGFFAILLALFAALYGITTVVMMLRGYDFSK